MHLVPPVPSRYKPLLWSTGCSGSFEMLAGPHLGATGRRAASSPRPSIAGSFLEGPVFAVLAYIGRPFFLRAVDQYA